MLEDGLVVPGNFIARCHADKPHAKKLILILKTELEKKKLKLAHMKLNVREIMLRNTILFKAASNYLFCLQPQLVCTLFRGELKREGDYLIFNLLKGGLIELLRYMKKILDSDWLRAVQFQGNNAEKKVIQ